MEKELRFSDNLPADGATIDESRRFRDVAAAHGVDWTTKEAFMKWEELSFDYDAGWLQMPINDEDLWGRWLDYQERCDRRGVPHG